MISKWLLVGLLFISNGQSLKIDFGKDKSGSDWWVINDGVMGGLSEGNALLTDSSVKFEGYVSLANNGGFASMKSEWTNVDLSAMDTIEIRYKSSGIQLAMTLENHYNWWQPYCKFNLPSTSDTFSTIQFSLKDFDEYRVGRKTGVKISDQQLSEIVRIGFITNEKREGTFDFEVDYFSIQ